MRICFFLRQTQRRTFCDTRKATEVGTNGGFPKNFLVSPIWGILSIAAIYGNYKMNGNIWNEMDDRNRAYRLVSNFKHTHICEFCRPILGSILKRRV